MSKLDIETEPYLVDIKYRGFVKGLTIKSKKTTETLCHYFGGIPYAQPPVGTHRFLRPRELAPCYQYGTRANPADFTGQCNVCPQRTKSKLDDEDCLQLNIYTPAGSPPPEGWPVYFYIHGGFLQNGNANEIDPVALLSETDFKAVLVLPSYRLNVYGFLASQELLEEREGDIRSVGNLGFWDQRLALKWTFTNITYFGGNASNITIGGYSAGAHSVFYQLAYDLDYPPEKRMIKRAIMHANGPGVQPKSLQEHQEAFDELLSVLKISRSLSAKEKLKLLRETSHSSFRKAVNKMKLHQFRACVDGEFVKSTLFQEIEDGTFAKKLLASNIRILVGESANEHYAYAMYYSPTNSAEALYKRLQADYPEWAVAGLKQAYFPGGSLPAGIKSFRELFGQLYADVQIHASQRGFVDALNRGGAGHLVHRYRIEWRSSIATTLKAFGATHGSDNVIWFLGNGSMMADKEKSLVRKAFVDDHARFIEGRAISWESSKEHKVRTLKADGTTIENWSDDLWAEKLRVWRALESARPQIRLGDCKSAL